MHSTENEEPQSSAELGSVIEEKTVLKIQEITAHLNDQGTSSDEAEFSSSSADDVLFCWKPRCKKESAEEISTTGYFSDLGYDSSTSAGSLDGSRLPEDLWVLLEGQRVNLPAVLSDEKPRWFDPVKYKTGQEFAMKYYFGVNFAEMLSLLILFSFDDSFKPLMFTNQSGTPMTSFKRYLSTVLRVKSWYEQDVFDKESVAYNNIKAVRYMHSAVSKRMNSISLNEINHTINILNGSKRLVSSTRNFIRQDFKSSVCPFIEQSAYKKPGSRGKSFFNQFSMSTTQFGFLGLMILYPEKFGAANATEKELEGFVHLWRVLGYLMGVEDRYNFCNGTLSEVKTRCRNFLDYWAVPNFMHLTMEWEHFSRCLVKGVSFYVPGNTFEVSILYLCYTLGINARNVYADTSWSTYFRYLFFKFTLCCALRMSFLLNLANKSLKTSLYRARNYSNERLFRLEEISDEFVRL